MIRFLFVITTMVFMSCTNKTASTGSIEIMDTALNSIIDTDARIEVIAEGFGWSEGPLWIEDEKMLLFSDVIANSVYKWTEAKGQEIYLTPSGYTGTTPRSGETGSNGLLLDKNGKLVLCQHGNRQIALMDAPLNNPAPVFKTIAATYQQKKFNSPNDAVYNDSGDLFFTDPPYGLEKNMDDPLKETPYQGVYKVKTTREVILLTDAVSRPNGIAITNDKKTLIVANSDPAKPFWYAFDFGTNDSLINARIFYDATSAAKTEKGMPDGFKIDKMGNIFATGPGGVWIFDKTAKLLGKIKFPQLTSNCAFSADEKTLFVTAHMYVLRIQMRK